MLMPSGDLLRMASTIIKLRELRSYYLSKRRSSKDARPFTVVTVSMDDFIADPAKFTSAYIDFLLGDASGAMCPRVNCSKVAKDFEARYQRISERGTSHVTHYSTRSKSKMKLEKLLRSDPLFGPILDRIEDLVNEALHS